MTDFLTVEDINSVVAEYYNVPFWDTVTIDTGESTTDFTDVKFNYLKVSREYNSSTEKYDFTIQVDNDLWDLTYVPNRYYDGVCSIVSNNKVISCSFSITNGNKIITTSSETHNIDCNFYLNYYTGFLQYNEAYSERWWRLKECSPNIVSVNPNGTSITLTFESLDETKILWKAITLVYITISEIWEDGSVHDLKQTSASGKNGVITVNINNVSFSENMKKLCLHLKPTSANVTEYILINIYKKQNVITLPVDSSLYVGRVNTFTLVSDSSNLSVESNYPVTISGKDVTLDLTGVYDIGNVDLTVRTVEDGSYYPNEWQFKIPTSYPTITTEAGLTSLFSSGGVGRLGADLTLSADLTLTKDVMLIGNDKTLTMANHKVIVPTDKTFKCENTLFTGGKHTIHQNKDSDVELTNCTFSNCTADNGHGSVIDCSVDLESLNVPLDFTTSLTDCLISNCDMAILHGGDLTVSKCIVNGKISEPSYPYFLYQTDGTADITQSQFRISSDSQIATDIEFNSCIFTCGTDALVNNLTHEEWSRNNVTSFLTDARNSSSIDLTYYYDAIEDYITLQGSGYCHSVSGTDFVFKTNITPRRVE